MLIMQLQSILQPEQADAALLRLIDSKFILLKWIAVAVAPRVVQSAERRAQYPNAR